MSLKSLLKVILFEKLVKIPFFEKIIYVIPRLKESANGYNEAKKVNYNLHKNGYEVLSNFHTLMCNNGIRYWLTAGTLLGIYREKKFISHTNVCTGTSYFFKAYTTCRRRC